MYIARKRLTINGEYREIGQPVPEAEGWRTVEAYVRSGHLNFVEDIVEPVKKTVVEPEKKAEPKPEKKAEPKPEKRAEPKLDKQEPVVE
jgi:hypothetical protein